MELQEFQVVFLGTVSRKLLLSWKYCACSLHDNITARYIPYGEKQRFMATIRGFSTDDYNVALRNWKIDYDA